ncbi:MAG: hypothetical protein ACK5A2_11390, partial [Bacteroidota bacterium]
FQSALVRVPPVDAELLIVAKVTNSSELQDDFANGSFYPLELSASRGLFRIFVVTWNQRRK